MIQAKIHHAFEKKAKIEEIKRAMVMKSLMRPDNIKARVCFNKTTHTFSYRELPNNSINRGTVRLEACASS